MRFFSVAISIFFFFSSITNTCGQAPTKDTKAYIDALDNYVFFTNESIHGLLIVHRMLENFNKNINKYVDLPDQQINFYSNKDLPKDVFQDDENWFYEISPNEWYDKISTTKGVLPLELNEAMLKDVSQMKAIIVQVNSLRFELEDMINTLDLKDRMNQSLVYEKLEFGVDLYKRFYTIQLQLEAKVKKAYGLKKSSITLDDMQFPDLESKMSKLYSEARACLTDIYDKEEAGIRRDFPKHQAALKSFESMDDSGYNSTRLMNPQFRMYKGNIIRLSNEALKSEQNYINNVPEIEEYALHGKDYYYYNLDVINKFNRYGNGIVFEMNRCVSFLDLPIPAYFEMPHYFKVVYPKSMDSISIIKNSDRVVNKIPEIVNNTKVKVASKVIHVDTSIVEFKLFDSKIIDNDIVSISFNGEWAVRKHKLSQDPYLFTIELNDDGKNYLLLYADDMGRNPPSSIGISYMYQGKTQVVTMMSTDKESELIEIVRD